MKAISTELFKELRSVTSNIAMGWLLTRTDGFTLGFTSYSDRFEYDGVTYEPTNAFSGTAAVAKNNLSVDNMNAVVLTSDDITENDLKGGRWDNAEVKVFWICPAHPEWGICPIRGGTLGEIKIANGKFETELRSILQRMQQPYGDFFTLECSATLGDAKCKVVMDAAEWQASTEYRATIPGDASVGSVVKPTTPNGYWYRCSDAMNSGTIPWGTTVQYGRSGATKGQVSGDYQQGTAFTEGAQQEIAVTLAIKYGNSSTIEPTWPTTLGGTVGDGQVTWEAIYAREATGTVTGSGGRANFVDVDRTEPAHFFQYGLLTWLTGENAGLKMEVRDYTLSSLGGRSFELLEPMPAPIFVGDTYSVIQGCPKTRTKCSGLPTASLIFGFDNINNMRAFPDMPTEDRALATPNFTQGEPQQSGGGKG